jgi:hypothetical protein
MRQCVVRQPRDVRLAVTHVSDVDGPMVARRRDENWVGEGVCATPGQWVFPRNRGRT